MDTVGMVGADMSDVSTGTYTRTPTSMHEALLTMLTMGIAPLWSNPYLPHEVGHRPPNLPHVTWREHGHGMAEAHSWSSQHAHPLADVLMAWDKWGQGNGSYALDHLPANPFDHEQWSLPWSKGTATLVNGNEWQNDIWSMGTCEFVSWLAYRHSVPNGQCDCGTGDLGARWRRGPDLRRCQGPDLRLCRLTPQASDLRLCCRQASDLHVYRGGGHGTAPPRCQLSVCTYATDGPGSLTRAYAEGGRITAGHSPASSAAWMGEWPYGSWVVGAFPAYKTDIVPGHSPNGAPRWAKFTGVAGGGHR